MGLSELGLAGQTKFYGFELSIGLNGNERLIMVGIISPFIILSTDSYMTPLTFSITKDFC